MEYGLHLFLQVMRPVAPLLCECHGSVQGRIQLLQGRPFGREAPPDVQAKFYLAQLVWLICGEPFGVNGYGFGTITLIWDSPHSKGVLKPYEHGAPGEIRTPDLVVRSHALYPTELRAPIRKAADSTM